MLIIEGFFAPLKLCEGCYQIAIISLDMFLQFIEYTSSQMIIPQI